MAASVVCDAPEAARGQKEHLVFERICAQRPAVTGHHALAGSPIVVVELRAVLRPDRAHCKALYQGSVAWWSDPPRVQRPVQTATQHETQGDLINAEIGPPVHQGPGVRVSRGGVP